MTLLRLLQLCCLSILLSTCDSAPSTPPETSGQTPPAPAEPYPSLPVERMEYLYEHATYLDGTFFNLPISINQNEPSQIRSTIAGIAANPAQLSPGCEPIGHLWFQVDGANVEEADLYFSKGCVGFVWYDQGKPHYSNEMTQRGRNFFANILQSVQNNVGQ